MNLSKELVQEIDRIQFVEQLKKALNDSDYQSRLKKSFTEQLDFLCKCAGHYYYSHNGLKAELLRPYLIALVDGEQALEDRFDEDLQRQIQAVYDIAFLREIMVAIKNRTIDLKDAEKQDVIQNSNMKTFREKLNSQQAWLALLKVMQ